MERGGPGYPMGVVRGMTGLSERQIRYYDAVGLVSPRRTSGGHRLYSLLDVEKLLNVKALLAKGLSTSEVRERLSEREDTTPQEPSDRRAYFRRSAASPMPQRCDGLTEREPGLRLRCLYPLEERPEVMKSIDRLRAGKAQGEDKSAKQNGQGGSAEEPR